VTGGQRDALDSAELAIVALEADAVARAVSKAARLRGYRAETLTPLEYAATVDVRVGGETVLVEPDVPLLLRAPSIGQDHSPDAEFLVAEASAVMHSAAALQRSVVINRPSAVARFGRTSGLLDHALRAATIDPELAEVVRRERFTSRFPSGAEALEVEEVGTGDAAWVPEQPHGAGPYRARGGRREDDQAVVVVLGGRWWARRPAFSARHDLGPRSAAVLAALDLTFGSVHWQVADEDQGAAIDRVSALPGAVDLEPFLFAVSDRLVDLLVEERGGRRCFNAEASQPRAART
jgi:hypothetical protein